MKTDAVIVRYSEVGLKGKNRNVFENRLVENIRACLRTKGIEHTKIIRARGRIFVLTSDPCLCLQEVFGIATFSPALIVQKDPGSFLPHIEDMVSGWKPQDTFRVSVHRADKKLPFTSSALERELGAFVVSKVGCKVSLENFTKEVCVELFEDNGYLFSRRMKGPGGLPLGASGTALLIVEDERSLAAGWLMMKRGVSLVCAVVTEIDCAPLSSLHHGKGMKVIRTSLLGLDEVAGGHGISVAVSSQDIGSLAPYPSSLTILRPLVGYSLRDVDEIVFRIR